MLQNITMASGDGLSFSASGALSFSQGDAEADSDRLQLLVMIPLLSSSPALGRRSLREDVLRGQKDGAR
ncbi:hypothetical protein CYMTET_20556 [Cymbomonas tetramitiformis]|uniref:Uncharacterized protein n=1 Tax=Cymbomonas tetramitiformis TaxID=36881 RepID=A0AAE0G3X3_9CHLO|nr:hypothetical protein CYMTET_20556 [Cymbomonas tetramitiformis]